MIGLLARFSRDVKLCLGLLRSFSAAAGDVNLARSKSVFNAKSARDWRIKFPRSRRETELACLECFPSGLTFYLGRTATLITGTAAN